MTQENREFPEARHNFAAAGQAEVIRAYIPQSRVREEKRSRPPARRRSAKRALLWMFSAALLIRLIMVACTFQSHMNPVMTYWFMGQEEAHVAQSIVQGHGFGNPLYVQTGPTAWFAPIYPYILAVFFKVFGLYTTASCIAILCFDALVSALTCLPIFFFSRRAFGTGAALAAGWAWAFYPGAVYWPVYRVWDTWLATLLLAVLFCVILKLAHTDRVSQWIGFGLLAGVAALVDPTVLSVVGVLALWAVWRLHRERKRWFAPGVAAALAVMFTVSPWMIRNEVVFHRFIPIRDNLPLEFRVGNNGDSSEPLTIPAGPWVPWIDNTEWNGYVNMGELRYFHWKGEQARAYITQHPVWYAGMIGRRIIYIWTGFWSFSARYLRENSMDPVAVPLLTLLSILTFMGLARAWRRKGAAEAAPYALTLIFFPLIYYVTHVGGWYRCPMEPFLIVLASYEVESRAAVWVRRRRAIRAALERAGIPSSPEQVPAPGAYAELSRTSTNFFRWES